MDVALTGRGQKRLARASVVLQGTVALQARLHYVNVLHGWWCLKEYSGFGLISHG